jgi:hypothetical protein
MLNISLVSFAVRNTALKSHPQLSFKPLQYLPLTDWIQHIEPMQKGDPHQSEQMQNDCPTDSDYSMLSLYLRDLKESLCTWQHENIFMVD